MQQCAIICVFTLSFNGDDMLRFFLGLILVQIAALLIYRLNAGSNGIEIVLLMAFTVSLLAGITALWFSTISRQLSDQRIAALKEKFAAEREKINVKAERAKTRLVKKTQKEIETNARRANTGANFKVGAAIAVAAGFGVMMMFTQFITLGLLTLTTAGGAVGGYLARSRREDTLAGPDYKLIDAEELEDSTLASLPAPENADPLTTGTTEPKVIEIEADTESKSVSKPSKND
ncbi:hypothetical protein AB833_14275 [Chromatiales bacterium (ex Bugula neritina AB1)]|nr:hypothetical protein AB833_14275 [Chromatiales bacterium (ex Bugula neritina AB1)]